MSLVLVDKDRWPLIKQKNVSVKNVEKIFLERPYGIAIVINEYKQPIGCFSLAKWITNGDMVPMQKIKVWKSRSEISADDLRENIVFPIVNDEGKFVKIYYETEAAYDASSDQLIRLMEIKRMGYDFKHFFDKSGCNRKMIIRYRINN